MNKRIFLMFLMLVLDLFCVCAYAEVFTIAAIALSGLGAGLQAWANYSGMKQQVKENQRAEALGIKREDESIARSENWANLQFKENKKQAKTNSVLAFQSAIWNQAITNANFRKGMAEAWKGSVR